MAIQRALRSVSANAVTGTARQWLCPQCSQSTALPGRISQVARQQRRTIYEVPRLERQAVFTEHGVDGLFSAGGFRLGWTEYQKLMITKLNELTAGRNFSDLNVKELAVRSAHNPATAKTFNHASMAHNNHFFFQQFTNEPRRLDQYPELESSLTRQFGSIETLRQTFLDTAMSMFGPGFVWLVWSRDPESSSMRNGTWKILCTYNAGTPYPEAGFMQQGLDMNTNNAASFERYKSGLPPAARAISSTERIRLPPGGTSVMPVLCVSVWEHTYIYDFGVEGKANYLNEFWNVVDWHVVATRAPREALSINLASMDTTARKPMLA